jgi:hypothetical protein
MSLPTPPNYRSVLAILLATVTMFASRSSRADEVDDLIEQGVALRVQGRGEDALDLFTRAHALAPSARTLAQIGLVEGALHRWLAAAEHLSTALASHDTPWIEFGRNRAALEQALAMVRTHVGNLTLLGPAGAVLTVNGREVGRLPLLEPIRLADGPVHLRASAAGYVTVETEVVIVGGGDQTMLLRLSPLPQVAAPAVSPGPAVDESPPPARWKTWMGGTLIGLSAAGIAAGVAWLLIDGDAGCTSGSPPTCRQIYDTKFQGWIAIGAGVAAGVAGGMLLWSGRSGRAAVAVGPRSFNLVSRF